MLMMLTCAGNALPGRGGWLMLMMLAFAATARTRWPADAHDAGLCRQLRGLCWPLRARGGRLMLMMLAFAGHCMDEVAG